MVLASVLDVQLTFNLYTALTLWAAGLIALATYVRLGSTTIGAPYWLLAGLGMLYLGCDERLDLHERLGERLTEWNVSAPGFHDIDGLVLVGFAVVGLAVSVAFRAELTMHREVLALLVAGAGFTLVAFVLDDFTSNHGVASWAEERAEWLGALGYFLAFLRRAWLVPRDTPRVSALERV